MNSNLWIFGGHQSLDGGALKNTGTGYNYDAHFYRDAVWLNVYREVEEELTETSLVTGYSYDRADNLTWVTDAEDNDTGIDHNMLGQKDYMDDPDMGEWEYGYNGAGYLVSQTDALTQTIFFEYPTKSVGQATTWTA